MNTEDFLKSRDDYLKNLKKKCIPVDLEDLEKRGIIRKLGIRYEILDLKKLPDHVGLHVSEAGTSKNGFPLWKIKDISEYCQKSYKEKTGKEYNE